MIAVGWIVVIGAVVLALGDERLSGAPSWVIWLVGAAVVHDLIVLPLVIGAGWLLGRLLPPTWRTPIRAAVIVSAVIVAATWPIAQRWGARADNPSILPLDVGRHLTVMVLVLVGGALGYGALATIRSGRRRRTTALDEPAAGPAADRTGGST